MRRALLPRLPQLAHFYHGAINALNVEQYTVRELVEHLAFMDRTLEEVNQREH